jgi:putative ABC transport system permease protein
MTVITGNNQFLEKVDVVDPGFFQVIRLPLVEGSPTGVFAQPESIVLSQKITRKYFGDAPAIGKTVTITGQVCDSDRQNCETRERTLVVTGIMRDLPHNTQLLADLLIPNTSAADPTSQDVKTQWMLFAGWGYVQLAPGVNPAVVVTKIKTIIDHSLDPKKMINVNIRGSEWLTPSLAPFRDDHLSTDQYGGMAAAGSWTTVYGFAAIGVLILLVACFNFMNLATARAMLRAREISLRKCVGAARHQLIVQFLGESVLIALLALVLALAMVEVLLPVFDTFVGRPIALHYLSDWPLIAAILAIAVLCGLLSGVYPALVLSGFRPATILRASSASSSGSGFLRTSLVVLQFAVSIGLGVAVAVVFAQISFARNIDAGFQKSGIVLVNAGNISPTARDSFADALRGNAGISDVAISDTVPLGHRFDADSVRPPGGGSSQIFRIVATSSSFA